MGEIARMLRRYIAGEVFRALPRLTQHHSAPPRSGPTNRLTPSWGCAMNDLPTEPEDQQPFRDRV